MVTDHHALGYVYDDEAPAMFEEVSRLQTKDSSITPLKGHVAIQSCSSEEIT